MSSLVADYGSDSDSIDDDDVCADALSSEKVGTDKGKNYLVTQDSEESSDSENDEKEKANTALNKEKLPNPLLDLKLPKPELASIGNTRDAVGSVFGNRYESAEMAKKSILEKHVKMTEAQFQTGKKAKICKKFKQGRCFYGTSCQYSHDIDSNLSLRYKKDETVADESASAPEHFTLKRHSNPNAPQLPPPPVVQGFMGTLGTLNSKPTPQYSQKQRNQFKQQDTYMQNAETDAGDDDKFNVGDKRKKRVGVSQTLVPPKKAMSALNKQRHEERPWTVQK